jgi:hypothetical protein
MSQALIQAIDAAEVTVTFYNMNNGQFVPVQVKRVYATGTTATNLVSMPINAYSR